MPTDGIMNRIATKINALNEQAQHGISIQLVSPCSVSKSLIKVNTGHETNVSLLSLEHLETVTIHSTVVNRLIRAPMHWLGCSDSNTRLLSCCQINYYLQSLQTLKRLLTIFYQFMMLNRKSSEFFKHRSIDPETNTHEIYRVTMRKMIVTTMLDQPSQSTIADNLRLVRILD